MEELMEAEIRTVEQKIDARQFGICMALACEYLRKATEAAAAAVKAAKSKEEFEAAKALQTWASDGASYGWSP